MINDELLHKWVNGTLSQSEAKEFESRPEYESLKSLYLNTEHLAGLNHDSDKMLERILQSKVEPVAEIIEPEKENSRKLIPLFLKMAIAASFIILSATFLFNTNSSVINTSMAETIHKLPSGSEITLFPDSEFLIHESSWGKKRKVDLKGKAYFNVTSGKEFVVNTVRGNVKVLGTSFLVDSKDKFHVNCDEGKVQVYSNKIPKTILIAGESFTAYQEAGSIIKKNNMTKITDLPLSEILKDIEKTFEVKFISNEIDLTQKHTSGYQHDNLENAIKTISMSLNIQYTIQGSEVTLSK